MTYRQDVLDPLLIDTALIFGFLKKRCVVSAYGVTSRTSSNTSRLLGLSWSL